MIKNIVFDIGGVLLKFNPENYLDYFNYSGEKVKALRKNIFTSPMWKEYLKGTITTDDFKNELITANPTFKKDILDILDVDNLTYLMPPMDASITFLNNMLKQGYKIYILSNINDGTLKYFKDNFDIDSKVYGAIYSCQVGILKPDKAIFNLLLEKYDLVPAETLFLDDTKKNIDTAAELGIQTIWFREPYTALLEAKNIIKYNR